MKVRRSVLIMPVHIRRFVERAWARNADMVVLDLEDSVPLEEKETARRAVREAIPLAGRGGAEVAVRINHETLEEDCRASVWPGLSAVLLPKAETAEEVRALDALLTALEGERGLPPGSLEVQALIESARGVWNAYAIASASGRVRSFGGVSDADTTADLGVPLEALREVDTLAYARGECDLVARALGREVAGRVWSPGRTTIADYGDPEQVRRGAEASARWGFRGGVGIHPVQVDAFNRAFTPSPGQVEEARRALEAFEGAWAGGKAYGVHKGRVVDARAAQRVREFLAWAEACARKDQEKAERTASVRAQEGKGEP